MKKIERLEIMIERCKKQPKTKANCELIGKLREELQKEINKR